MNRIRSHHDDSNLHDIASLSIDATNYEDLGDRIVRYFAQLYDADLCTLWRRVHQDGQELLILSASYGFDRKPGEELPTYRLDWDAASNQEIEGVTAWIAVRNKHC